MAKENKSKSKADKTSGKKVNAANLSITEMSSTLNTNPKDLKKGPAKSVTKKDAGIGIESETKKIKKSVSPKSKKTLTAASEPIVSEEPVAQKPIQVKRIKKTDDAASTPTKMRKITFQIKFHTKEGQSLGVVGNHPLLGSNNITNGFPLQYLNTDYWYGTLDIPEGQTLSNSIQYKYYLKDDNNAITLEWGDDKEINPALYDVKEIAVVDTWNYSGLIENTFYTEPFKRVLLKHRLTYIQNNDPTYYTHIFKVKAPLLLKNQAPCILGSIPELGEWNTEIPLLLSRREGEDWYSIKIDLSSASFPISYKYGVYDVAISKFVQYEGDKNRFLFDNPCSTKVTVVSDGFMVVPNNGFKGAGVAIPVFSLRTESSLGVGEFNDIKPMVDWAKEIGLKVVQVLPVNDTTATYTKADSYPYAAISAFALHPLYLHLPAIVTKQNEPLISSLHEKQQELNSSSDVNYEAVMEAKWRFIETIFPLQKQATFKSPGFKSFFDENAHWLVPYAAFCYLRNKYKTSDFNQWQTHQKFNPTEVGALAASPLKAADEITINYFVQYHLHCQLKSAADYAHANGIIVKGDIPIGIYRYSCDAWQEPHLYNMDMQAGAPPDDFAVKGQNWGFPTYNWQAMQEDGFSWWKKRFKQMSYYFDAFRIDHILGFFRIWSIPMDAVEGIMGHFVPAAPVHVNEFAQRGITFSYDRFCRPFINDSVLWEIFGQANEEVKAEFLLPASNGNYILKEEFDTQRKVEAYFALQEQSIHNRKLKQGLFDLISNVILFEEGSGNLHFHFRISVESTASFRYLDSDTQHKLRELYVNYYFRRQDSFWYNEAMKKLPELKRSTNMLICGEDLGMVPACVPGVMKDLAILSLEIQRMPKDPARPFFHPNDAPFLSVVTPSTHDMSTIRGWWEEDRLVTQQFYNQELGQWGTAPYYCEPWINELIVKQHLYSPAMWSIFQLQDLLGIDGELRRENPNEERINIPADPKHYWRYRMHLSLESLLNQEGFNNKLKALIQQSGR